MEITSRFARLLRRKRPELRCTILFKSIVFPKMIWIFLSFTFLIHSTLQARIAVPFVEPPPQNPHPAITATDQKRVEFGVQAAQLFFKSPFSDLKPHPYPFKQYLKFYPKDFTCLQQVTCYSKDWNFIQEVTTLRKNLGTLVEIRHPHIVPAFFNAAQAAESRPQGTLAISIYLPDLEKGEYLIHLYARFSNTAEWYHLQVIVSEDPQGILYLRHFYFIGLGKGEILEC